MDLLAHSIAQRFVDTLVASHTALALEFGRHDGGEEMAPVAFDLQVFAGQPLRNEALDVGWCGVGHDGVDYD